MVRARPPTPRRSAAPLGPVSHTQRPRAGRRPLTPPPAESAAATLVARGICPLAGPGRADAMLRDEGTPALRGPRVGEGRGGRVGTERGGRNAEARPDPSHRGPRGRHHAAPRGLAGRAGARAGDCTPPRSGFSSSALNFPGACALRHHAGGLALLSSPPTCSLELVVGDRGRREGEPREARRPGNQVSDNSREAPQRQNTPLRPAGSVRWGVGWER